MRNARRFIAGLLIAATLLNTVASGDGTKLLFFGKGTPKGVQMVPPAGMNGPVEIKRHAIGNDGVAGALTGWGSERSVITGTGSSGNLPIVYTEDYDQSLNLWPTGPGTGHNAGVFSARVSGVTVQGPDTTGTGYLSPGYVGGTPADFTKAAGDISGATNATPIVITSSGHTLETGAVVTISGVAGNTAANGTWTITKVNNNSFSLNTSSGNGSYTSSTGGWVSDYWADRWQGIFVRSTGGIFHDVAVSYIAGTGATFARGTVAGTSSGNNHGVAIVNEKGVFRDFLASRCYRGLTYAIPDGFIGGQIIIQGCRDWGMKVIANAVQQTGAMHIFGVWSGAPRTSPASALWLDTEVDGFMGENLYLENSDIPLKLTGVSDAIINGIFTHTAHVSCIVVDSGCKNIALNNVRIGSHQGGTAPDPVVDIAAPWTVLNRMDGYAQANCRMVRVSDGRGQRFLNMYGWLIDGATGIELSNSASPLNQSIITAHFDAASGGANGCVGLDLKTAGGASCLGANNIIIVQGGSSPTWAAPETIVDLPTGWSTTPKNTTNWVIINGVRYYPPSDEFASWEWRRPDSRRLLAGSASTAPYPVRRAAAQSDTHDEERTAAWLGDLAPQTYRLLAAKLPASVAE